MTHQSLQIISKIVNELKTERIYAFRIGFSAWISSTSKLKNLMNLILFFYEEISQAEDFLLTISKKLVHRKDHISIFSFSLVLK